MFRDKSVLSRGEYGGHVRPADKRKGTWQLQPLWKIYPVAAKNVGGRVD